jgi:hypothetical protein
MDIEDLFNEDNHPLEESKEAPLVIPEFGPCSVDGEEDQTSAHQKQNGCCKNEKCLVSSDIKCCEETKSIK